ncbi:hypothetical protein SDC9_212276 [bioreactor metagenome]|uniref:Uncharacterized protein n=1 Tax=bioreactor metagenome TaxID=1076179 RepID=A0A645JLM6_9ZZZZ
MGEGQHGVGLHRVHADQEGEQRETGDQQRGRPHLPAAQFRQNFKYFFKQALHGRVPSLRIVALC